jgi:hypothetical protein
MPRDCTVCVHPDVFVINERLVGIGGKLSNRSIAKQYGVDHNAVQRHRKHIPELLAKAPRAEEVAEADRLLDRIEELQARADRILTRAEETDNYTAMLGGIREMRANLELIGEVTKELDRTPTLNLHLNPVWLELRTTILAALDHHPEARESVVRALEEASNGRG